MQPALVFHIILVVGQLEPGICNCQLLCSQAQSLAALQAFSHWLYQFHSDCLQQKAQNADQFRALVEAYVEVAIPNILHQVSIPASLLMLFFLFAIAGVYRFSLSIKLAHLGPIARTALHFKSSLANTMRCSRCTKVQSQRYIVLAKLSATYHIFRCISSSFFF